MARGCSEVGRWFHLLAIFTCLAALPISGKTSRPLEIYFIDVEGGQATLVVHPHGQNLLIDTGWNGFNGRDADRIAGAAEAAGIRQIDYLLITHYHRDHVGGVAQLAGRMKIVTFVDHGPNLEDSDSAREGYAAYEKVVAQGKRLTVKPGDRLPFNDMSAQVLTAAGEQVSTPLPGGGQPNPVCDSEPEGPVDVSENARSLGVLITYGKFRFIDLGDLTRKEERELVCPNNLIGTVDLYLTTHHGLDQSNAKVIVEALHPRVAVMNNGPHKGGKPQAWETVHNSTGLQDLWQIHYALDNDPTHNSPEMFIANLEENCGGKFLKVTARPNGSFTVFNSRNHYSKTYSK